MISLNLPSYKFRFKKDSKSRPVIFDFVRKKWLVLTPEEWVRQNWLRFINTHLGFPEGVLKIETGIKLNENQKRSDVLVYKNSNPCVLIECKAPEIKISEATLSQALNYNKVYEAKYIVLTNGLDHHVFVRNENNWNKIDLLPFYSEL